MGPWYRVFGRLDAVPPAEGLAAGADASFESDERGWLRGEVRLGAGAVLELERWTAEEEGIRAELNGWAAYLETCERSPHHVPLMERMIQTRQLFTLHCPDETRAQQLCQWLAAATDGVYQADGAGFFAADGSLLVPEG